MIVDSDAIPDRECLRILKHQCMILAVTFDTSAVKRAVRAMMEDEFLWLEIAHHETTTKERQKSSV